jgi:nicotinamidase-related amidase
MPKFRRAALLVVDVQKAIDAPYHAAEGSRNNPDAEENIGRLLAAWRRDNRNPPLTRLTQISASQAPGITSHNHPCSSLSIARSAA